MPFNLRQLELFGLLMQTRNVTETARLLSISQPAVSQSLKELERQLDIRLFVRRAGRISPTAEARALMPEIERLFLQMSTIASRASELRDATAGSLSIAAIPTLAGSILPKAVAAFRTERPRVRIEMNAYDKPEIIHRVREEQADLGILYGPVDDPQVAVEPVMDTSMLCLMPPESPLAAFAAISLRQLLDQTVIMHPSTPESLLLHERLQRHEPRFDATLYTNLSFAAVGLVRQSVGVFVTEPMILLSGIADGLVSRAFEPDVPQQMTVIYSRHRSVPRVVVRFMAKLRSTLDDASLEFGRRHIKATVLR